MITIFIGGNSRPFPADKNWIVQQIRDRKRQGDNLCVRFKIQHGQCDLMLKRGICHAHSGGNFRRPKPREQRIIDLWNKILPKKNSINVGNIISFQNQLNKIIN